MNQVLPFFFKAEYLRFCPFCFFLKLIHGLLNHLLFLQQFFLLRNQVINPMFQSLCLFCMGFLVLHQLLCLLNIEFFHFFHLSLQLFLFKHQILRLSFYFLKFNQLALKLCTSLFLFFICMNRRLNDQKLAFFCIRVAGTV
jgi:hypothetical protein